MIYIICNPAAGNGRAKKIVVQVESYLKSIGVEYKVLFTKHPGHATTLAQEAVRDGAKSVFSVGGDGTACEIACALMGTQTALGIIPAGTGNDFIKTLGYPKKPLEALKHILACSPKPTDVGKMNDRMFLNETGTGFDVTALKYTLNAKKYCKGILPYLYGVICAIIKYQPIDLTYQIDDQQPVNVKALVCGVANGGIIGGGIPIAPGAKVDDGLFDVIIVKDIPKKRLPFYLPKLLAGKVLSFPETLFCRAKKVNFSAPEMTVNLDGELIEMKTVNLTMDKGALMVHR